MEWLRSYLDRRMQYVCYNGIEYGVPHGTMYRQVTFDLKKTLTDWFKANQLSVNPSKTRSIHNMSRT